MKIGYVEQASVGQLNYAMLHDARSPKARNGAFTDSVNWDMDKVHIAPVQSSLWKSPVSGNSYYTRYRVTLDGARPRQRARLLIAAKFTHQEVNAGAARRQPVTCTQGPRTRSDRQACRSGDGEARVLQCLAFSGGLPWPARAV